MTILQIQTDFRNFVVEIPKLRSVTFMSCINNVFSEYVLICKILIVYLEYHHSSNIVIKKQKKFQKYNKIFIHCMKESNCTRGGMIEFTSGRIRLGVGELRLQNLIPGED